jgi:L-amino acid N-acyltransferase YncA
MIAPFSASDEAMLFDAYAAAVEEGGAFPRRPPARLETFRSAWLKDARSVQVARLDGALVGGYFIKPAFPGLAAHIANAGYLVVKEFRGRGIGRQLAEHSLVEARLAGFDAMLFTLVLEGNPSRRLWESLGFTLLARVPDAVAGEGSLVYWRSLEQSRPDPQHSHAGLVDIRAAGAEDAQAIAAVFDQAVLAREGTFRIRTPPVREFATQIATHLTLVALDRGTVVGWVSLGPYMPARDGIGLYQLYIDRSHRGRGIGTRLLCALVDQAERDGYFKIVGRIFASNQPAIRVAQACGFRQVGLHQRHGQVDGRWQDVLVFERLLGPAELPDPGDHRDGPELNHAIRPSDEAVRAELRRLEEALWRPESRFNRAFMESVLAEDFIEFGSSGRVWSREEILDMPAHDLRATLPLSGLAITPIRIDAVLLTYTSEVIRDRVYRSNRSSIWVRVGPSWRLRFHQGTPAAE